MRACKQNVSNGVRWRKHFLIWCQDVRHLEHGSIDLGVISHLLGQRRWARYKKHQVTRALRDGIPAASVEVLLDNIRYSGRPWAEPDWMGLVTISHCGMGNDGGPSATKMMLWIPVRTGTPGSEEGFDHTKNMDKALTKTEVTEQHEAQVQGWLCPTPSRILEAERERGADSIHLLLPPCLDTIDRVLISPVALNPIHSIS